MRRKGSVLISGDKRKMETHTHTHITWSYLSKAKAGDFIDN